MTERGRAGIVASGLWAMLTLDTTASNYAPRLSALSLHWKILAIPPQVFL